MIFAWVRAAALVVTCAAAASGQQILTMSQSTNSITIGAGSSACGPTPGLAYTVANGYFRSYPLSGFPVSIEIVSITFGVQTVIANQPGGFPMAIRLFMDPTPAAPAPYTGLILRHTENFTLPSTATPTFFTQVLTGPVTVFSPGEQLVVELFSEDGTYTTSKFLIGSNALGQSAPSYIRAPACSSIGIGDIADLGPVGFPNMQIILDVNYVFTTLPAFPGTGEDLQLLSAVGTQPPTGGLANQVKNAVAGNPVTVEVLSPLGGFNFREVALLAQAFPTGVPPFPPAAPNIHMTFPGLAFVIGGVSTPFGPTLLAPTGTSASFVVPPGLTGTSVLFQGVVITFAAPFANNGLYATTDGHEIRL